MTSMLHVLVVCAVVVPVTALWLAIVVELFRRRDLRGVTRLMWLLLVLELPVIGSLVYVLVTWLRAGDPTRDAADHPVEEAVR